VTLLQKRAKDAEQKLTQQEHMVIRLEDRTQRDKTSIADKDALLGRRQQEVTKLQGSGEGANADLRKANRALEGSRPCPSSRLHPQ
jgi:hypothetical protein